MGKSNLMGTFAGATFRVSHETSTGSTLSMLSLTTKQVASGRELLGKTEAASPGFCVQVPIVENWSSLNISASIGLLQSTATCGLSFSTLTMIGASVALINETSEIMRLPSKLVSVRGGGAVPEAMLANEATRIAAAGTKRSRRSALTSGRRRG